MKKIFLFIALIALSVTVSAQGRYYDSSHKYGFFSNCNIGLFGQASFYNGATSFGAGGFALKYLDDYCRFRAEASANGFKATEGFDRNGTILAGLQVNFVKWAYLFAEGGAVINPSMPTKAGLAGSVGLGLSCNFGKWSGLIAEGGYDALQHGAKVDNMFFARVGYYLRTGITERDRVKIDIENHVREGYGELKQENTILKNDLKRKQEDNDTLMAALAKASELFALMEKRLDECTAQVAKTTTTGLATVDPIFQIFFDYASCEISPIEDAKVEKLAEYINATDGYYRIEGYASPDGDATRNEVLSGERARAVYWRLIAYGVDDARLIPSGNGVTHAYGGDSPLNRMVTVTQTRY